MEELTGKRKRRGLIKRFKEAIQNRFGKRVQPVELQGDNAAISPAATTPVDTNPAQPPAESTAVNVASIAMDTAAEQTQAEPVRLESAEPEPETLNTDGTVLQVVGTVPEVAVEKLDFNEDELDIKKLEAKLRLQRAELERRLMEKEEELLRREERLGYEEAKLVQRAISLKRDAGLEKDVRRLLAIIDELLGHLPGDKIEEFIESDDYELYERVLDAYKVGTE